MSNNILQKGTLDPETFCNDRLGLLASIKLIKTLKFQPMSPFGPGCVKTSLPHHSPRNRRPVSPSPRSLFVEPRFSLWWHLKPPDAALAALMGPFLRSGGWLSRLDGLKERDHTEYRQYSFEVVRQDMQAHLGAHLLERFGLEVGIPHPGF